MAATPSARSASSRSRLSSVLASVFAVAAVFFLALSFIIFTTWKFSELPVPRDAQLQWITAPSRAVGSLVGATEDADDGPVVSRTTSVSFGMPADREEVTVHAHSRVLSTSERGFETGSALFEEKDTVLLNRGTAYPVDEPAASFDSGARGLIEGHKYHSEPAVRTGLQYRFPATTDKASYLFFDTILDKSVPIDFVDVRTYHGKQVFTFEHELGPVEVDGGYVAIRRHLAVEPTFGIIVDMQEHPLWFTADSQAEAEQIAAGFFERGETTGAVFSAEFNWDEATKDAQWAEASRHLEAFDAMRLGQYLTRAAAFILFIAAAVAFVRSKN